MGNRPIHKRSIRGKVALINKFTTRNKGLHQVLGHLEQDLLNYLWDSGEATGRQVFDAVSLHRQNAYHTILTVLNRMVKKGLLSKKKKAGFFHFSAALSREEFELLACQQAIKSALSISHSNAISAIVNLLSQDDPELIDELECVIEQKRRQLKEKDSDET